MWTNTLVRPGQFAHRQVDAPSAAGLQAGQVIVRLLCGAVCGSDLPHFRGHDDHFATAALNGYPLHEIVGEIVESRAPSLRAGDRVVGYATGARGLSEFFVNDSSQLITVSSSLSNRDLVLVQPLATVLSALARAPKVQGLSVAVVGQGPIGLLWSHAVKSDGARRVTGVDQVDHSSVATALGVDEFVWESSNKWAAALADRERPALVIEAVGHQVGTMNDAIVAVAPNGHVVAFGVPDDDYYPLAFRAMFRKHVSMTTGTTTDWHHFLAKALAYVESSPEMADRLITHEFSVTEAQEAFRCACEPATGRLKVAIVVERG
jgi:threonine dehydrogenase-like Zn-dependent dehydrogenase